MPIGWRMGRGRDKRWRPISPSFRFVADLVDGQRRARPQFQGFCMLEFGLASERENGGRRRRNRRRKEIKGKLDNRLVSDVAAGK